MNVPVELREGRWYAGNLVLNYLGWSDTPGDPPYALEVALARAWLETSATAAPSDPGRSSYALKHVAEQQIGRYVSNGSMIAAALEAGIPISEIDEAIAMLRFRYRCAECGRALPPGRRHVRRQMQAGPVRILCAPCSNGRKPRPQVHP